MTRKQMDHARAHPGPVRRRKKLVGGLGKLKPTPIFLGQQRYQPTHSTKSLVRVEPKPPERPWPDGVIPDRPSVAQRVERIVEMMLNGEFRRGHTIYKLALEWGISVQAAGNNTAEASRVIRMHVDPIQMMQKLNETIDRMCNLPAADIGEQMLVLFRVHELITSTFGDEKLKARNRLAELVLERLTDMEIAVIVTRHSKPRDLARSVGVLSDEEIARVAAATQPAKGLESA